MYLKLIFPRTEEITKSFGWQNNEEQYQEDIQEASRVLFSVLEEALMGTVFSNVMQTYYW